MARPRSLKSGMFIFEVKSVRTGKTEQHPQRWLDNHFPDGFALPTARTAFLADEWDLAAEPWIGRHPPWMRLQHALKRVDKPLRYLARLLCDAGHQASVQAIHKVVGGETAMKPHHYEILAPAVEVPILWLRLGITARHDKRVTPSGLDYFVETPAWLHASLETLLREWGCPINDRIRRRATIEGLKGHRFSMSYFIATRNGAIIHRPEPSMAEARSRDGTLLRSSGGSWALSSGG